MAHHMILKEAAMQEKGLRNKREAGKQRKVLRSRKEALFLLQKPHRMFVVLL